MVTEKQKRCIYGVAKKVGYSVDKEKLNSMDVEEASKLIDELKEKLEVKETQAAPVVSSEYNAVRLGLAAKLVFNKFSLGQIFANGEVSEQVIKMYDLLNAIEKTIKERA